MCGGEKEYLKMERRQIVGQKRLKKRGRVELAELCLVLMLTVCNVISLLTGLVSGMYKYLILRVA